MSFKEAEELIQKSINAHDPNGVWSNLKGLKGKLKVRGNILMTKLKSPLVRSLNIELSTERVFVKINDFPERGSYGTLENFTAKIHRGEDTIERSFEKFSKPKLIWDDLDLLFFFAYAFWNYTSCPFIFQWEGFKYELLPSIKNEQRLLVTFPDSIPTHCRTQIFHFNEEGFLCRLNYTADVFWAGAKARHYCHKFRATENIIWATHRYVYPYNLPFGKAMEGWVYKVEEVPK